MNRKYKFSKELQEKIIIDYTSGESLKNIADSYKISETTLKGFIEEKNSELVGAKITKEMYDDILKMKSEGIKVKEIAKKHDVIMNTVYRVLRKGVPENRKKINLDETRRINLMYLRGVTKKEIAEITGHSQPTICILTKNNKKRKKLQTYPKRIRDKIPDVLKAYNNDVKVKKIARDHNITIGTVKGIIVNCELEGESWKYQER